VPAVKKTESSEFEREMMRLILRYMGVPTYEHEAAAEAPGVVLWFKEVRRRGRS
jgi:hypothetical protein